MKKVKKNMGLPLSVFCDVVNDNTVGAVFQEKEWVRTIKVVFI